MPVPSVKPLPSLERLQEVFNLDGGVLRWRKRPNPQAKRVKVGAAVGSVDSRGYLCTTFDGAQWKVRRIVFKLHHGREPGPIIDHLNNDHLDNRPENLCEASQRHNTIKDHPSKALFTGASATPQGRWQATASCGRKSSYFGKYDTAMEASFAYSIGVWMHENGMDRDLALVRASVAAADLGRFEHLFDDFSA